MRRVKPLCVATDTKPNLFAKENSIDKIRPCGKNCGKIVKIASYPQSQIETKADRSKNRRIFDNKITNNAESILILYCG